MGKQSIITYSSKADFVSKVMEATNAVFRILKVVVFDETKSEEPS